ncbi:MAG: SOS response-associated peptidase family protein [Pseudomonadota bacterium]
MPGRLILTSTLAAVADAIGRPEPRIDATARRNIEPGQEVVALGAEGFFSARWGIIPVGRKNARGRPVMETIINARSETLFTKSAFSGTGRAAIPADGWYEWTGERGRKTAWRIGARDGAVLWFAAISDLWVGPGGLSVRQVAAVTCAPNDDVRDVHHRMGVLLAAADLDGWLTGSEEEAAALLAVPPAGRLKVERAGDVDWSAP